MSALRDSKKHESKAEKCRAAAHRFWNDPERRKKHKPWNKGLTKETDKRVKKNAEAIAESWKKPGRRKSHQEIVRKRWKDLEFRAKMEAIYHDPEWHKKQSEKVKEQFSTPSARKMLSDKLKAQWKDPKFRRTLAEYFADPANRKARAECARNQMLEQWKDLDYRKRRSKKVQKQSLRRWQDPDFKKRVIQATFRGQHKRPNKPESELLKFIQKNDLGYEYVGDGKEVIAGKVPDFLARNGHKKIIELFGDYFHKDERPENGGDNGAGRKKIFAQEGFQTLIVWEHELRDEETLLKRLIAFDRIKI